MSPAARVLILRQKKTTNINNMKNSFLLTLLLLLAAFGVQAQNITVHGTVISKADSEPLIGATVFCTDTKVGTSTDIDGAFTLTVPEGAKLKFSYVGYTSKEETAAPR